MLPSCPLGVTTADHGSGSSWRADDTRVQHLSHGPRVPLPLDMTCPRWEGSAALLIRLSTPLVVARAASLYLLGFSVEIEPTGNLWICEKRSVVGIGSHG